MHPGKLSNDHEINQDDIIAIRHIINTEVKGWNNGDAILFSKYIAKDCSFTNIVGAFFKGYQGFFDRHAKLLNEVFMNTTMEQKMVDVQFVRPDVAIVETLIRVSGVAKPIPLPGVYVDDDGCLHTRLCQVMVKVSTGWKIAAYHNVDIKVGIPVPDMNS
ncbi:MAG TPA: SgcJ/EcaC family oxidoreductase [Chitinophagaceae bacterium]